MAVGTGHKSGVAKPVKAKPGAKHAKRPEKSGKNTTAAKAAGKTAAATPASAAAVVKQAGGSAASHAAAVVKQAGGSAANHAAASAAKRPRSAGVGPVKLGEILAGLPVGKPVGSRGPRRTATLAQAMEATHLAENTVRRDVKAGAPCSRTKKGFRFNLEEYGAWRLAHNRTGKRGRPPEEPETPELAEVKLKKLIAEERIKRAQADRDERKAELERGTHQKLEDLHAMLIKLGGHLRGMVERMQKRFGPEVAMMFNEGLDEFDGLVREQTGKKSA